MAALAFPIGCGARSSLDVPGTGGAEGSGGTASTTSSTTSSNTLCAEGATRSCGTTVGACLPGTETCHDGAFGPCLGTNDMPVVSSLLVTGSVPSSPSCIDFPVHAGSTGTVQYPCAGGTVTADLGGVAFTGSVTDNYVKLDADVILSPAMSPDHNCTWDLHHHIEGSIASGTVTYSYSEMVVSGTGCWSPCTETGTVTVERVSGP
jgi:hypothetical protein